MEIIMLTEDGCGSCKSFKSQAKEIAEELGFTFKVLHNPEINVPFFPYFYMMNDGEVVEQWPRLDTGVDNDVFPTTFFASYIVRVDNGPLFITSLDDEEFIRAEEDETQRAAHNELRLQLQARLMAAYSKYEWRLWPDPNDAHGDDSSGSGFSDPGCC